MLPKVPMEVSEQQGGSDPKDGFVVRAARESNLRVVESLGLLCIGIVGPTHVYLKHMDSLACKLSPTGCLGAGVPRCPGDLSLT